MQQRYSYLRPKPGASFGPQLVADGNLLDFCLARGMTLLPYSPLLGGAYTREDKPIAQQYVGADTDARLSALRAVAEETGATVHQVIFAWMMQHEQSVVPVFSASNAEQMREDLGGLDVQLTDDQMTRLNDASA